MIEIGLGHYLSLGAIIFFLGVIGIFLNRKNVIVILMSIELILLLRFFYLKKCQLHLERILLHLKINNDLAQFQSSIFTPLLLSTSLSSIDDDGFLEI